MMSENLTETTPGDTGPTQGLGDSQQLDRRGPSDALSATLDGAHLLTPEEVARALRQSRTRIYEMMASRELRSVKLGRSRRVSMQALREYVHELEDR